MKALYAGVLAAAWVLTLAGTTLAADWAFYGSARMATFSADVDPQVAGVSSDTDTQWSLQGNSRIGAYVTAGDVGGRFEYGSGPNLRHLYGTWNFGVGTILIGQTFTPLNEFYSNQVYETDNNLNKEGMIFHGRRPQIMLRSGGFELAFVEPNTQATLLNNAGATVTSTDNDATLPQVLMAYRYASDLLVLNPFLGWATYDFTTGVTSTTQQESVDSLVYGFAGKVNFGPGFLSAGLVAGSNVGNMGITTRTLSNAVINAADGKLVDNDTLAYAGVVGFKANDIFKFEAGYGSISSEVDVAGIKTEDTGFSYYIQSTITLAPGVIIVPEAGIVSDDEIKTGGVATKQSETTYFGAKWQINF
jgi:hypothetical protein